VLLDIVSDILYIFRVSIIGKSKLQVMSATSEDPNAYVFVSWDFVKKAACSPGIEVTVGENDV
jgi:hypothetical protein